MNERKKTPFVQRCLEANILHKAFDEVRTVERHAMRSQLDLNDPDGSALSAPVADHVKPQSTTEASLNS